MMKTVLIDVDLYKALRICAIEYGISVTRLIETFLEHSLNTKMPVEFPATKPRERELLSQYFFTPPLPVDNCQFLTTTEIAAYITSKSGYEINIRKLGLQLRAMQFQRVNKKINGIAKYRYEMVKKGETT